MRNRLGRQAAAIGGIGQAGCRYGLVRRPQDSRNWCCSRTSSEESPLAGSGDLQQKSMNANLLYAAGLWLSLLTAVNPAAAEILWRGDFETGTTEQWRGAPRTDSVQVVTEP